MMQEINNRSLKDRFMKFMDDFAPPGIGTDRELSGFIGGLMGHGHLAFVSLKIMQWQGLFCIMTRERNGY